MESKRALVRVEAKEKYSEQCIDVKCRIPLTSISTAWQQIG